MGQIPSKIGSHRNVGQSFSKIESHQLATGESFFRKTESLHQDIAGHSADGTKLQAPSDANGKPKVVVGLYCGTTHCGFAYAQLKTPGISIIPYFNYTMAGGQKSSCKILAASYYKQKVDAETKTWVLKSWSYRARVDFEKDSKHEGVYILNIFDPHLASPDNSSELSSPARSKIPPGLTVDQVITDYLREMGKLVLRTLQQNYGEKLTSSMVQWCVTLPSVWANSAKQRMRSFMIEAGLVESTPDAGMRPYQLVFVPESEATTFHCLRSLSEFQKPSKGDRILIVDFGDEATDIVVQEFLGEDVSNGVREVRGTHKAACFGSLLDARFMDFLHEKIGPCLKESIKNPSVYRNLMNNWEEINLSFGDPEMKQDECVIIQLPNRLTTDWAAYDNAMGNPDQREAYDVLEVSYSEMKPVYDPVVNQILALIEENFVLASPVKYMVVVGAFAGSEYLKTRMDQQFLLKNNVEPRPRIIKPPNPGSAVCQGAVGLLMSGTIAPDFLEIAADSGENVTKMCNSRSCPLQIHERQCRYLSERLAQAVKDAKEHVRHTENHARRSVIRNPQCQEACKNIYYVAKDIERLVIDCCKAQWLQAAVVLVDVTERTSKLLYNLDLYMVLLRNGLEKDAVEKTFKEISDPSVRLRERDRILENAKQDQRALLMRLEAAPVGISPIQSNVQESGLAPELHGSKHLEGILLERLSLPENLDLRKGSSNSGHLHLWKVDHKNLRRTMKIGKGTFATVYRVEWFGEYFAEKCLIVDTASHRDSLKKEAALLTNLAHPNITTILSCAERNDSFSLILELMKGDLKHLLHERMQSEERSLEFPFDLLEAVDIMLQIAEGMHYLHQKKIVHRDLKAANILYKYEHSTVPGASEIRVKVADFGLSKIIEMSCTPEQQTLNTGTTLWMAPELFGPSSTPPLHHPLKVDVYSFAGVCIEILTGKPPEYGIEVSELRKRMTSNPADHNLRPHIPSHCPAHLARLIADCWHPTPSERPTFAEICDVLGRLKCSL
jgi:tRNA A-37 threonylcarbamoyl transferase component Bud32